jgi:hypothetical protein
MRIARQMSQVLVLLRQTQILLMLRIPLPLAMLTHFCKAFSSLTSSLNLVLYYVLII